MFGENGLIPCFSKSASIKSSHFVSFFSLVIFLYLKVMTPHTNFLTPSRVLAQKPQDTEKIYSLHEPHIYCVAKGKEHKKYEFGTKASVAMTKTHGVIVAAVAHEKNLYDAHTLPEVLDQAEAITDTRAARAIVDRGYRGRKFVDGTEILVPGRAPRGQSRAKSAAMRKRFVAARLLNLSL